MANTPTLPAQPTRHKEATGAFASYSAEPLDQPGSVAAKKPLTGGTIDDFNISRKVPNTIEGIRAFLKAKIAEKV